MPEQNKLFDDRRCYRPEEVGKMVGLSRAYVYNLIQDGILLATRHGKVLRIQGSELNRYMTDCQVDPLGIKQ